MEAVQGGNPFWTGHSSEHCAQARLHSPILRAECTNHMLLLPQEFADVHTLFTPIFGKFLL